MADKPSAGEIAARDRVLIMRFLSGEEGAFDELYTHHHEMVYQVCFNYIHDRQDAQELTQDTFMRVHRGLLNFRGDSSFSTWVRRIAINLSHNRYLFYRRRCKHLTLSFQTPLNEESVATFSDVLSTNEMDAGQNLVVSEFGVLVDQCMDKLSRQHKEILILRNLQHYPYDRIAEILGIKIGTVKSRLARARMCLRKLMGKVTRESIEMSEVRTALRSRWFKGTPLRSAVG